MAQETGGGLRRTLSLWQVVLYGLGVTIGAGIYVLVGVAAGRSGIFAPIAFLAAALLLSFTALSFAELGTRLPVTLPMRVTPALVPSLIVAERMWKA